MSEGLIDFPPFFTLQTNPVTRAKQLNAWTEILRQSYAGFVLELNSQTKPELFRNRSIGRELDREFCLCLCDHMKNEGLGEWISVGSKFLLFKKTVRDWADLIHAWASRAGKFNSIDSAFSLVHGPDSKGEPFHEIPETIVLHALRDLEKSGKCELIFQSQGDFMSCGVKFFA